VKSDPDRMLHEARDARRFAGGDEPSDFVELIVFQRNGDFGGRHTRYHTIPGTVTAEKGTGPFVSRGVLQSWRSPFRRRDAAGWLCGRSRATGRTISRLIRDAIDAAYTRSGQMSRAERARIARRTAGAWTEFAETGAEYVERIRGARRLARLHGTR
jgi:hypothetical protein